MQIQTALPEGVRRQAERAKQLQGDLGKPLEGEQTTQQPGNTAAPKTPATPSEVEQLRERVSTLSGDLAVANSRYNVLNGKYQAEVPRLNARAKQLETENEQLKASKTTTLPAPGAQVDASAIDLSQYYSPEDIALYGDKLLRGQLAATLGAVTRTLEATAKAAAKSVTDPLTQQHEQQRQSAQEEQQSNAVAAEARFQAALSMAIPGWEQQNEDAGFMAWLNQFDPAKQRSRMALLKDAHAAHDSETAIEIFKAFREGREIGASSNQLQNLRSPGQGQGHGNSGPGGEPEGKVWTRAEISAHYAGVTKGHMRGRDEEKKRIDADIIAAGREGRIRG